MGIPLQVWDEVIRQQREDFDWPYKVPKVVEFKRADNKEVWIGYEKVGIDLCEQITEYHVRRARAAIRRWNDKGKAASMQKAARHILIARIMRCKYIQLMGIENSTEADMPEI